MKIELYSSKKPYGNKTVQALCALSQKLYSSKKPYGNKTQSYSM